MKLKKRILRFGLFLGLVIFCVMERAVIESYVSIRDMEAFRNFQIDREVWLELEEKYGAKTEAFYEQLTLQMMQMKLNPAKHEKTLPKILLQTGIFRPKYKEYMKLYQTVLQDIECFPVAWDIAGGETISFDDSWGGARTYGGNRRHEGTDIMTSNNVRGYFPIVSMSDGIVEKKGWLPQGGYRLGIRSASGAYFYYAHLHSYADGIEEGVTVGNGDLIGFMGDTGYSEIEGTVGKFDVHLHMGIYIDYESKEMSVNPYQVLKYYEGNTRKFYNRY